MQVAKLRFLVFCNIFLVIPLLSQDSKEDCPVKPKRTASGQVQLVDCHGNTAPASASSKPAITNPSPVEQPQTGDVAVPADSETAKAYYAFLTEHYKFDISTYQHAEAVFAWQHTSSIIIFWVSILLVLAGLVLAALQFRATGTQTFKASWTELEINSSVVGLVILTISLAFFFLYLKFVYPIQLVQGIK